MPTEKYSAHLPNTFQKTEEKMESRTESKEREAEVSHQNYVGVNGGVLLQTARAGLASHEESHGGRVVRVIFGTGSQRTYLTERTRDALNLVTVRKVPMMIKTFGQDNETVQICDLVRFIVKSSEGDSPVPTETYVMPVIFASLQGQNIEHAKQTYLHLNGLKLADETCEQQDAEIYL